MSSGKRCIALLRDWSVCVPHPAALWDQSTGPRTAEGKARNGFKGGRWRELRALQRTLTRLLRDCVDALRRV